MIDLSSPWSGLGIQASTRLVRAMHLHPLSVRMFHPVRLFCLTQLPAHVYIRVACPLPFCSGRLVREALPLLKVGFPAVGRTPPTRWQAVVWKRFVGGPCRCSDSLWKNMPMIRPLMRPAHEGEMLRIPAQ